MRKFLFLGLLATLIAFAGTSRKIVDDAATAAAPQSPSAPKYVFLFIGDGMSTPQRMIADEFARKTGHSQLAINTLPHSATTRSCSANSLVTDSAAAATAIACGEKTNNGRIGMASDGTTRLESCAEVAHKMGYKVGIVTSVTINHATPSGFYAHRASRGQLYQIGLDLVASNFEYFGGGGLSGQFDKKDDPEYQGNIYELAEKAGYVVSHDKAGFEAIQPGTPKVLALIGEDMLRHAIDGQDDIPTLAEFTQKGIELLNNPKGFFMMVEGGSIDYAGHANDAATNLREVLAFDDAVRVALDFQAAHPADTLILVTGDHETGGMTMGFAGTGYALYMERLANQKCSIGKFTSKLKKAQNAKADFTFEDAKPLLTENFGFLFEGDIKENPMVLTEDELQSLQEGFKKNTLPAAARILISHKSGIAWTSGAHTALPVLTTAGGPCAELFTGFIENCDIANILKKLYLNTAK